MNADDLIPQSEEAMFLNDSPNDRWTHLKPVIVSLYMDCRDTNGKAMTYAKVAAFMKRNYNFHAAESQYKRWFTEWGIRKRILGTEKRDIVSVLGKRRRPGQSTSNVTLQQGSSDKPIDKKQLVRHLKSEIQTYKNCRIAPGVLSSWSLPYAAWTKTFEKQPDHPSPFGTSVQTPNYINIESPAAISPGKEIAPPSPTMQLVEEERAQYRSSMLLQGQLNALLTSLGRDKRMVVHNLFHDFYIHSFVTAKFWGKGPLAWSAEMTAALIGSEMSQPAQNRSDLAYSPVSIMTEAGSESPTNLCNWAIHLEYDDIMSLPERLNEEEVFDIRNPDAWTEWPKEQLLSTKFTDSMQKSLENHTFSHTLVEDLPISMNAIASSFSQDPRCLEVDALKLAIIAGNEFLVFSLLDQIDERTREEMDKIYPFHLAIAFLDGSKSCCGVFERLMLMWKYPLRPLIDSFGHTIFDSLMISILSSHTDLHPQEVSLGFRDEKITRFPGEEKDICGRWDTDSPIIRRLFEDGNARIPVQWKHPFCHTSAQAICHVLSGWGSGLGAFSGGLFARYCSNCGLKLKLGTLHTLIVVAASLARNGMAGETLFGAIAVLTCLLKIGTGTWVLEKFDVSVEDLYGIAEPGRCYHKPLDAFEFIQTVPGDIIGQWSSECQVGWECMVQILRIAAEVEPDEDDDEYFCEMCKTFSGHCGEPKLGLLWATIQTELLTYRRVDEGMPWISAHFSMQALEIFLKIDGEEFDTPLVKAGMMRPHSECGRFGDHIAPIADDVCDHVFMNMIEHSRISLVPRVNFSWD